MGPIIIQYFFNDFSPHENHLKVVGYEYFNIRKLKGVSYLASLYSLQRMHLLRKRLKLSVNDDEKVHLMVPFLLKRKNRKSSLPSPEKRLLLSI